MVRKLDSQASRMPAVPAGTPRIGPPPSVAPMAPVPTTPAPPAPPSRRPLTGEAAWMAEIMFEAGFDPRMRAGGEQSKGPALDPSGGFTRAQLTGSPSTPVPEGQLIRTPEQFRQTLAYLFDPKRDAAVDVMEREAILRATREVWDPRKPETNRRIATEFMRYFVPALGEAYGFQPAPVAFDTAMTAGYNGLYDHKAFKVYLPESLLRGSFAAFVEILVHEEMHCLQEGMIGRLYLNKGQPLIHEERAVATYWLNERPKYRSAMANGSDMSPETRRRYNAIGQEYHSITTGKHIAERFARA